MAAMAKPAADIPTRPFGRTGVRVSILGMGGWHMIVPKTDADTVRLVHEAIDSGITFFDNAWDYNDGVSEERMGKALAGRREQAFLMTKVCTHGRDGKVAMRQLEDSLRRLRTDYLDLWQIHEVAFDDEPRRHFAKGGAVEALDKARQQGKVRFVGFTGHKDPALHLEMLSYDYKWDAVQMPINCFDGSFRSFEQQRAARAEPARHRPDRDEIALRRRARDHGGRRLGRGSAALQPQPADCHAGHGNRHAESASAGRRHRAGVQADVREGHGGIAQARRSGRRRRPVRAVQDFRRVRRPRVAPPARDPARTAR